MIYQQARNAYLRMTREANYRPQAPSDGYGNITGQLQGTNLYLEAIDYAKEWASHETVGAYPIGFPDAQTREALILTVEAARCIAGMEYDLARRLLTLAASDLKTPTTGTKP